jgi:hypothetical protein
LIWGMIFFGQVFQFGGSLSCIIQRSMDGGRLLSHSASMAASELRSIWGYYW